ncbi:MAG: hypothetical protein ACRC62_35445, partial [Microcoleus sp.]
LLLCLLASNREIFLKGQQATGNSQQGNPLEEATGNSQQGNFLNPNTRLLTLYMGIFSNNFRLKNEATGNRQQGNRSLPITNYQLPITYFTLPRSTAMALLKSVLDVMLILPKI